jgi:hypothetical protein
MLSGSRPGLLVTDLLSADGPFLAAADAFLALRCARCGRGVEQTAVQEGDTYYCPTCWLGSVRGSSAAR